MRIIYFIMSISIFASLNTVEVKMFNVIVELPPPAWINDKGQVQKVNPIMANDQYNMMNLFRNKNLQMILVKYMALLVLMQLVITKFIQ